MKVNRKLVSVGLGAVLFLQAVSANAALNGYLHLTGQKQGTLKGSSTTPAVFETVKLKNATITKIDEGLTEHAASSAEREHYLRLTVDYQELHTTVVNPDGTTTADDWAAHDQG